MESRMKKSLDPKVREELRGRMESAPYFRYLGFILEELDTGFARFRMPFRKELTQALGVVQGGAISSLADATAAYAVMTLVQPEERTTTVEFKFNFLASVREGDMVAEARMIHRGKRLVVVDMEVKNNEKLIAKGLATYRVLSFSP